MRKYTIPQSMSVEYLLTDHLGSTSLTTDSSGARVSERRYTPFGEIRYSWTANLSTTPPYTPTRYTFTGQYSYMDDPAPSASQGFGLMFYVSRWYDPSLGRFVQADTLIPESTQGTQAWDRYAYVNNNPVRYNDPSGHCPLCLTAVIGGAIGGIVGAVGYTAYVAATGHEWNATHFWAATGGGALAGALIGTGIGIAEGLTVAGVTTAAVESGAAVEGANLACGGDMCASEVQDASQAVQEALPAAEDVGQIIFRNASGTPDSLTPRLIKDIINPITQGKTPGLSFWNSFDKLNPGKYVAVDTSKLKNLNVIFDNDPEGHVTVTTVLNELTSWANTRGVTTVMENAHRLTQEIWEAAGRHVFLK
jgi:RHS repeat-associated protein